MFLNVTLLTQLWSYLGGTEPIDIPTPNLTFKSETWMSCEQPSLATTNLPLDGFTATASSKFVILTLVIVILDPAGSIPSVFRGFVGIDNRFRLSVSEKYSSSKPISSRKDYAFVWSYFGKLIISFYLTISTAISKSCK